MSEESVSQEPAGTDINCRWQYIDEVESLIGTTLFYDEHRAGLARNNQPELDPTELTARELMYTVALRTIAQRRYADRQAAKAATTYSPAAWNQSWNPLEARDAVRADNHETLRVIGRQLVMLNNVERELAHTEDHPLRPNQLTIRQKLGQFYADRPRPLWPGSGDDARHPLTAVTGIIAPTGSGKTALMGNNIREIGIGKPATELDPTPLRALVIVPSRRLVKQYTGITGNNTFARFNGGVKTTPYFSEVHDLSGDVVVTTKESWKNGIRSGEIKPGDFDVTYVDEAHHLHEPQMRELHQELGTTVIGATATKAYNEIRDLKRLMQISSEDNLVDYIRDGLLNSVQLFTFLIEDRSSRFASAVEAAAAMVAGGRRGAVFCERGDNSYQARLLAKYLENRGINAGAVGSFQKPWRNDTVIKQYDEKKVDVVTTVDSLREGWDADVSFVIVIGKVSSKLKLEQIIGRGTRPNPDMPLTVIMEFGDEDADFLLWDVFGLENIDQGRIIGEASEQRTVTSRKRYRAIAVEDLPAELQQYAIDIDHKPVRQVTVGRRSIEDEQELPDGVIRLSDIAVAAGITESSAQYRLEKAGFACWASWEVNPDTGFRNVVRNYDEAGITYLLEHPNPPKVNDGEMSVNNMAVMLGVSTHLIQQIINNNALKPNDRTVRHSNRTFSYYAEEDVAVVAEEVAAIAWATDGELMSTQLAKELGCSLKIMDSLLKRCKINRSDLPFRRCISEKDQNKMIRKHLSADQADTIRQAFSELLIAQEGRINFREIFGMSKKAGQDSNVVGRSLSPEEQLLITKVVVTNGTNNYLPIDVGLRVANRIMSGQYPLPPNVVPMTVIEQVIPPVSTPTMNRREMMKLLKDQGHQVAAHVKLGADRPPCYEWPALQALEQQFGRTSGAPEIPYDSLPTGSESDTPDMNEAARSVQRRYIDLDGIIPLERLPAIPGQQKQTEYKAIGLDPHSAYDILYKTGYDPRVIRGAARVLRDYDKDKPVVSDNQQAAVKYSGGHLDAIMVALIGVSPVEIASQTGVPVRAVESFFNGRHQPKQGRYNFAAWRDALKEFQRPPADSAAVSTLARKHDLSEAAIVSFVTANGGGIDYYHGDTGKKQPYLAGDSYKLIDLQHNPALPLVGSGWFNREEISRLTGQPLEAFDEWAARLAPTGPEIRWHSTRDGEKVLPHYAPRFTLPFIRKYIKESDD